MFQIRNEEERDYQIVEEITRKAFYNMYMPGCVEHYLVHIMRGHEDFIPELDFVAELDGRVIGNIMYTKSRLADEQGEEKSILTFGSVSILPEHQRKWTYSDSPVMAVSEEEACRYDDGLEKMEKRKQPSQEEFYILSHSFVE